MLWRRALIYTHRWLGIAGGALFVVWFGSGIVMMYAGMPALDPDERLRALAPIDLDTAAASPADVVRALDLRPVSLDIGMLGVRPVYRFSTPGGATTVFADTGARLVGLTPEGAVDVARRFSPADAAAIAYDARLEDADQWTFSVRPAMPLHRLRLGDAADTRIYVADGTGEVVMKTTRESRRWGYLGAVLHWLYFAPFRRNAALWAQAVIWLSLAGSVLSASGLIWGLWRYSTDRRYRLKGVPSRSPYAGLMRWHHYAGLLFGLTTFTWVFSGLLSMDPLAWSPSTAPTTALRTALAGGPLRLDEVTTDAIRTGLSMLTRSTEGAGAKNLAVIQFEGEPFATTGAATVSLRNPDRGAFGAFDRASIRTAMERAMPGVPIEEAVWLDAYDTYYYDRSGGLALPVLRVRYLDGPRTWLYADPTIGAIVLKHERLSRLNRWLYHGLHSLDFPFLYYRRPLWDVLAIALSLGGLVLSLSTMPVAWHRLRRHARRLAPGRDRRR